MAGLPDMPPLGSDLATETLNRLAAIAEATNDTAFLLRARQRLLPTIDAPKTETVLTAADWVMFRRARTHLCGPACTAAPATTVETFQIWHLKLDSDKLLTPVREAIDRGDAKALAEFKFTRVGLLRYRDESAFSEESDAQVLAMWRAAQPAARVALGRVWEIAPTTGQGWQNHMRLRRMLETIDPLTRAPRVGDGSLTVAAPPPGALDDRATDGGMLVVTISAQVKVASHRVVMLPEGSYLDLLPLVRAGTAAALRNFDAKLRSVTVTHFDLDLHFDASGGLVAADATALTEADRRMRAEAQPTAWFIRTVLASVTPDPEGTRSQAQHEVIGRQVQVIWLPFPQGGDEGAQIYSTPTDFGRGAAVLTLLGYVPKTIG
jgi:hypothetical protein